MRVWCWCAEDKYIHTHTHTHIHTYIRAHIHKHKHTCVCRLLLTEKVRRSTAKPLFPNVAYTVTDWHVYTSMCVCMHLVTLHIHYDIYIHTLQHTLTHTYIYGNYLSSPCTTIFCVWDILVAEWWRYTQHMVHTNTSTSHYYDFRQNSSVGSYM